MSKVIEDEKQGDRSLETTATRILTPLVRIKYGH